MTSPVLDALERDAQREAALRIIDIAVRHLARTRDGAGPVSTACAPAELAERFAGPLPRAGHPLEDVAARLERDVVSEINRLAHPMYMGHQVSAPLPASIWTEAVIGALNQSIAVREMSPSATMVETQLVRRFAELVGWGSDAGGTFTSGGTEATFTALLAARARAMPDAWECGVGDGQDVPVVVCGEHAHYAVTRAVAELGLGMRRAVAVPSRDWKMDVEALVHTLDRLAVEGRRVMAVVATAGSTATGSFDDLEAIGRECERRGIWLHVDGAHGATALISDAHRHRVRGIERARSVAWDPHKLMLMPLSAGMLLVRDERDLSAAFAQRAPYLFHHAEGERAWDQGTRSFMCSRRADALKLWVALQRYGLDGLAALHDALCARARELYEAIAERTDFAAMHEPESNIVCFRWVGARQPSDPALDEINAALREQFNSSGRGWITATILGERRVLRVTIMNPRTTRAHLLALLDGLASVASEVAAPRQR